MPLHNFHKTDVTLDGPSAFERLEIQKKNDTAPRTEHNNSISLYLVCLQRIELFFFFFEGEGGVKRRKKKALIKPVMLRPNHYTYKGGSHTKE